MPRWYAPPEWKGETVFIICGGPSLLNVDIDQLRGQKVIATNSSIFKAMFAQICVYADQRWYDHHSSKLAAYKGKVVCCAKAILSPYILHMRRSDSFSDNSGTVFVRYTVSTAAINLAVHLGAKRIALLGLDGKHGDDGRCHHHEPHPSNWSDGQPRYHYHRSDLEKLVQPLKQLNIECVLATPDSAYSDIWPTVDLSLCLLQSHLTDA